VAMIWKKKLQGLMILQPLKGKHVFGVAHIFASFNDTFIHVTNLSRKETLVPIT
ncbi:hypothetical protein HN51_054731, partial [Arachis hypogaea]